MAIKLTEAQIMNISNYSVGWGTEVLGNPYLIGHAGEGSKDLGKSAFSIGVMQTDFDGEENQVGSTTGRAWPMNGGTDEMNDFRKEHSDAA